MSDVSESKAAVINEILPVCDLLREYHDKLAEQPRATTATRQLRVIINKLDGWHHAFSLEHQQPEPRTKYDREVLIKEVMELVERKLSAVN